MSLKGPRGINFFLRADEAFVLMSRVADKTTLLSVLWEAEVLWRTPGMFSMFTSFILIYIGNPWLFILLPSSSWLVAYLLVWKEGWLNVMCAPIRWLGCVYGVLTGYGLFIVGLSVFAYYKMGWLGVVLYLVGNGVRIFLDGRSNMRIVVESIKNHLQPLPFDALCFLVAFKRIAKKYERDVSWNITSCDDVDFALRLFTEFKKHNPLIASRFGSDDEGISL